MKLSKYFLNVDLNVMSMKFLWGKVLFGIHYYWNTVFRTKAEKGEKKDVKSLAASVFTELFLNCIKRNKVVFILTKKGTATCKAHTVVFM